MDESLSSPKRRDAAGPKRPGAADPKRPGAADEAFAWCAAEVRRYDPDRYFASLLAGAEGRRSLFALYAFNLEIAKVREVVSEPMLGQIRLQWWREAIDGIWRGRPRDHAVVRALGETVGRDDATRVGLDRLIDARELDLEDRPPATLDELVTYAGATGGGLARLALALLGARDEAALAAGQAGGAAWALAGLLRAVPFHAGQGRILLPAELMAEEGASPDDLLAGRGSEALGRVVASVARAAGDRLAEARRAKAAIPRGTRAAVAHFSLIESDLRRLARAGHDVFALTPPPPFPRHCRILTAAVTGRW